MTDTLLHRALQDPKAQSVEEAILPVEKVELFKHGKVAGIFARGIKLAPDSATYLGIDISGKPTFDYLHLATDEIVRDEERLKEFKDEYGVNAEMVYSSVYVDPLTQLLSTDRLVGTESSHQFYKLKDYIDSLLKPKDNPQILERFKSEISGNPDKPFLIIYGHGGQPRRLRSLLQRRFIIGSERGKNTTDLQELLEDLDLNKYSAVLLYSCNKHGMVVKNPSNTPVYYAFDIVGVPGVKKEVGIAIK